MTVNKHRQARSEKKVELDNMNGQKATKMIKSLMTLKGVSMDDLAERLNNMGYETETDYLRNQIRNGSFKTSFFLVTLRCLNTTAEEFATVLKSLHILD